MVLGTDHLVIWLCVGGGRLWGGGGGGLGFYLKKYFGSWYARKKNEMAQEGY